MQVCLQKAKCPLIMTAEQFVQMTQSQNSDLPRSNRYLSKHSVHIRRVKNHFKFKRII